MKPRVAAAEICRDLDPARLEGLSEDALEAAEDEGLDGNQHYLDLSTSSWDDVRYALEREAALIRDFMGSEDPAAAEREFRDAGDPEEEREALWHLDVGVAAAVVALNVLGAHTSLSCNGGAFGGVHLRDRPSIRFYLEALSIETLFEIARAANVGVVEEEGRALLYARTVLDLQAFAARALERFGSSPI